MGVEEPPSGGSTQIFMAHQSKWDRGTEEKVNCKGLAGPLRDNFFKTREACMTSSTQWWRLWVCGERDSKYQDGEIYLNPLWCLNPERYVCPRKMGAVSQLKVFHQNWLWAPVRHCDVEGEKGQPARGAVSIKWWYKSKLGTIKIPHLHTSLPSQTYNLVGSSEDLYHFRTARQLSLFSGSLFPHD